MIKELHDRMKNVFTFDVLELLKFRYNLRFSSNEIIRSGDYNSINEYFGAKIANGNNVNERSESLGTQLGYTHEHEMKYVFERYGKLGGFKLLDYDVNKNDGQADLNLLYDDVEYPIELKSYRMQNINGEHTTEIQGTSHTRQKSNLYLFTGFDINYNADFAKGEMAINDLCIALVKIENQFNSNRAHNNSRSSYPFFLDKYHKFHFLAGAGYITKCSRTRFRTMGYGALNRKKYPDGFYSTVEESNKLKLVA
jgi:hypothetical protein